jgi:hypothetical protein
MERREFSGVPGGFFAAGVVDPVHPAAQNFVREAPRSKSVFMRATDFPQHEIGCVIFYARSDAGVSSSAARERELGSRTHSLSRLYFAGLRILHEFRQL